MNTYIKNTSDEFFAVRASNVAVAKLPRIISGEFRIVPNTKKLREAARVNVGVKNLRIIGDNFGYL